MTKATIKIRPNKSHENLDELPKVLQQIYANRGVSDLQQLDYQLKNLPSPKLMKSNIEAGRLLSEAIRRQDKLLIVADFDVDGATSCTLMMLALADMGAKNVDYLVPERFKFGYGLTPEIVVVAAGLCPDLIITVDNGIASVDGVAKANDLGIKVLILYSRCPK